jgi:putative inorganic carbon (hco3(-)) transporter
MRNPPDRRVAASAVAHRGGLRRGVASRAAAMPGAPPARQASAVAAAAPAANPIYSLTFMGLWKNFWRQPMSFKLVCLYLFMEYVRPQQIWTAISGPPYSKFIIGFAVLAMVVEGRRIRFGMPEMVLAGFTLIVLASCVLAESPDVAFDNLQLYVSWLVVYVLIANCADDEDRFLIFTFTFILYSFKMAQHGTRSWASDGFVFRGWGTNGAPGWFANSGEFGIQMCIFFAVVVMFTRSLTEYWPRWKRLVFWGMVGCAVMGIVGSSSRGALVGLAAIALWMLAKSRYKVRGLVGTAVLSLLVYKLLPPEQIARLQASGTDDTSLTRKELWHHGMEMFQSHPLLGIGYNNWSWYSSIHYGSPLLPHNIFVEAGAQMGILGLAGFIVLIVVTLVVNYRTRRIAKSLDRGRFLYEMAHALDAALIGYLACGFFVTVLFYPFFWINLAMTVGLYNAAVRRAGAKGATAAAPVPIRRRSMRGLPGQVAVARSP